MWSLWFLSLLSLCSSAVSGDEKSCKDHYNQLMSRPNGRIVGLNPPQCDEDGSYSAVQCREAVCYCANKLGQKLSGYFGNIGNFADSTCKCAREEDSLKHLFGKHVRCDSVGNYEGLQCLGSNCFCVEPKEGKSISTTTVPITEAHKLNC